ncbi:hypothetical protein [Leptolyngbya sp. FACHB-711]|uniref:hypothetical protein n=1 Tax=Leptolyngbya sp. FACHB-711 TaxID=2692813 RepID=UPI00168496D0|nr:hypothetical protein [Leptolyngbya sp. FACHB-711]MBD1851678.1 hypothetical protein [Cyanobacteria bacterium FACHB-502]MBD2024210.1 hypothetical protein [Leptolyngbya sp. FACHB-711]
MRTYVRGNCLSPEVQANLTAVGLKQYWQVDDKGLPIGKPYPRRSDIELHEKLIGDDNYEIIARNRGNRS